MNELLQNKVKSRIETETYRILCTPSLTPSDWFLEGACDKYPRVLEYREMESSYNDAEGNKIICYPEKVYRQSLSIYFIKRLEKMHNITLLNTD